MAGDNVWQEWSIAMPNVDKVVIMINWIHMLLIYNLHQNIANIDIVS